MNAGYLLKEASDLVVLQQCAPAAAAVRHHGSLARDQTQALCETDVRSRALANCAGHPCASEHPILESANCAMSSCLRRCVKIAPQMQRARLALHAHFGLLHLRERTKQCVRYVKSACWICLDHVEQAKKTLLAHRAS